MSTETVSNPLADLTAWFDQQEGVPCDWNGCDTEIAWKLTARCCGAFWFFCTEHKVKCVETFAEMSLPVCLSCHAPLRDGDWVWLPV